jgi:hypothetical protein
MEEKNLNETIINKVLSETVSGGTPTSYQVLCTAERVMLFFGVLPGSHRDALTELIGKQTEDRWVSSKEIAGLVGARLAIGHPELLDKLKGRLINALEASNA